MYFFFVRLLQPFPWLLIGLGFGLALLWRRAPEQRRWLRWIGGLYLLLLVDCLPITGYFRAALLEWQFPRASQLPPDTRAIVVLGGGTFRTATPDAHDRMDDSSLYRAQRAAELYQSGPRCPILISAGHHNQSDNLIPPARLMAEFLQQAGVDSDDLIVEDRSRTTEENARYSANILRERGITGRIVLVTSATHLVRAKRLFAREGIDVTPLGSAYHTDECDFGFFAIWPRSTAATINQEVFHELLGMAWMWVRGKL